MSKSIPVDPSKCDPYALEAALDALTDGGLVVSPTETRYALMAKADSLQAIARLCKVKGRSVQTPTAVFIADTDQMSEYGAPSSQARKLAARFLPGPLTLIVTSGDHFDSPISVDGKIGFRMSPLPFIRELVRRAGSPLTATSANRSGALQPDTALQIREQLGESVWIYLDGGTLSGAASTVVDCTGEPRVVRSGPISDESIRAVLQGAGTV